MYCWVVQGGIAMAGNGMQRDDKSKNKLSAMPVALRCPFFLSILRMVSSFLVLDFYCSRTAEISEQSRIEREARKRKSFDHD